MFRRRWFRVLRISIILLTVVGFAAATYFRVWSRHDYQIVRAMSRECHPIWKDLHWGRIRPGQDVAKLVAGSAPVRIERFGEFEWLRYNSIGDFTGVLIIARNGRIVGAAAGSCTWQREFFNVLTPEGLQACDEAYLEYMKAEIARPR